MKLIYLCLVITLAACGSNNNELTSKLLVEKKTIEDSLQITTGGQAMFEQMAKDTLHATHDTTKSTPLLDSSFRYSAISARLNNRLKEVDFTLDSLSKMK